jgi:predicted PurR-regulated permease PerM
MALNESAQRSISPLLAIAAIVIVIAGIKAAEDIVVPFLLAVFIATVAATPIFWLTRSRVPTAVAITLVSTGLIIVVLGLGLLVADSIQQFSLQQTFYEERLRDLISFLGPILNRLGIATSGELVSAQFDPGNLLSLAANTVRGVGSALSNGFLILLTVIFIIAEASSFPTKLRKVLTNPERDLEHFDRFIANVNRYIAIKTTISVATGFIVTCFLALIGVDFPLLWGVLAFMLNYVPTIGSIIAAIPAVLLALVQLGSISAFATLGFFLLVNVIMGNVVEPKFMGRGLGLSTLVVFVSLVFWGWVLGPVGMLLSVPLTITAKIALEANPATRWIAYLLGPAESFDAAVYTDDIDEE